MESKFLQNLLKHKVAIGVLVVLGVVVALFFSNMSSVRDGGIKRERALNAQYLDNQNYLSAYISGFYEQAGVLKLQSDKLNKILVDVVKGRYEKGATTPVSSSGFAIIIQVIREAYPEQSLKELMKNWGKLQDYIVAQRAGYRNMQSKLLDMIREYDTWRESGFWKGIVFNRLLGLPTDRLEARVGDRVWKGKEAREKMLQIVLTSDAKKAYETGEMDPLDPNK